MINQLPTRHSDAIVHVSLWRSCYGPRIRREWHGTCRRCEWGIFGNPLADVIDGAREHIIECHSQEATT